MENRCYLAMTAADFQNYSTFPKKCAWMSCHFSSYSKGLSNLPQALPAGAMLILDDSTSPSGHDPDTVLHQLQATVNAHVCSCVLLDFQKPKNEETAAMAAHLAKGLSCPVGISHLYAKELACTVLLPPLPPDVHLNDYIQPWIGREIWLELALNAVGYRVSKEGTQSFHPTYLPEINFSNDSLCCHYAMEQYDDHIDFTLWRTAEDLTHLMEQAEKCGISKFVGLWQELHP